jgi:hypothetical protein
MVLVQALPTHFFASISNTPATLWLSLSFACVLSEASVPSIETVDSMQCKEGQTLPDHQILDVIPSPWASDAELPSSCPPW